jgi:hypothetical protein
VTIVSSRIPHRSSDSDPSAAAVAVITRPAVKLLTQCPLCGRKIGAIAAADVRCPRTSAAGSVGSNG